MDRRTQKTKQALHSALAQLIRDQQYQTISVRQIIDRANVGRATFYDHYQNKDQLTSEFFGTLLDGFLEPYPNLDISEPETVFPALSLFTHIRNSTHVHEVLSRAGASEMVYRFAAEKWGQQVQTRLQNSHQQFGVPTSLVATQIVGNALTITRWWVENKMPLSTTEIAAHCNQLTTATLNLSSCAGSLSNNTRSHFATADTEEPAISVKRGTLTENASIPNRVRQDKE